ncbi:MAG: InlB B-repeat-containing protein [Bacillota bacterium]
MRYNNKLAWFISAFLLLLLLLTAQPAAAEAPFWDLDLNDKGKEFKVVDCQPGAGERELKRTVVQVIDDTFHKWNEYLVGEEGQFCIVLEEPEERYLQAEEARKLLVASQQWVDQVIPPGEPEYADPAEIFEMESLMPVVEDNSPDWVGSVFIYQNYALANSPERVAQSDTERYPWNTIGFVHVAFGFNNFRASGSLIGPHTVLTNAHNLYNSSMGGYFTMLNFYPGQYQASESSQVVRPYGYREAVEGIVPQEYITYEGSLDFTNAHDYGAFFIETPFEGISTYMPMEFDYSPTYINTAGYPVVVEDETTLSMWYARGPVENIEERELAFQINSGQGASGSPLWVCDEEIESSRVVGLLAQALVDTDIRRGPRLTYHNQPLIEEWMQWSPDSEEEEQEEETTPEGEETSEENEEEQQEEPEEVEVEYSVGLTANPSDGGSVSGAGTYLEGEAVTVTAEAAEGFEFVDWTDNGTVISDLEQYQFEVDGDLSLTANFIILEPDPEPESEPEAEAEEHNLNGVVIEVGDDLVRVDLDVYARAYYLGDDSPVFDYLKDGNQSPVIMALQSAAKYILIEEYAKNYHLYDSVSIAIENSTTVDLVTIEIPF